MLLSRHQTSEEEDRYQVSVILRPCMILHIMHHQFQTQETALPSQGQMFSERSRKMLRGREILQILLLPPLSPPLFLQLPILTPVVEKRGGRSTHRLGIVSGGRPARCILTYIAS